MATVPRSSQSLSNPLKGKPTDVQTMFVSVMTWFSSFVHVATTRDEVQATA